MSRYTRFADLPAGILVAFLIGIGCDRGSRDADIAPLDQSEALQSALSAGAGDDDLADQWTQRELQRLTPLAESGDPEAQYALGQLYDLYGLYTPATALKAAEWYELAASQGHTDGTSSVYPVLITTLHPYARRQSISVRSPKTPSEFGGRRHDPH